MIQPQFNQKSLRLFCPNKFVLYHKIYHTRVTNKAVHIFIFLHYICKFDQLLGCVNFEDITVVIVQLVRFAREHALSALSHGHVPVRFSVRNVYACVSTVSLSKANLTKPNIS